MNPSATWQSFQDKVIRREFRIAEGDAFSRAQLDAMLDRSLDAAIHGFIDRGGALTRGEPTIAEVSGGGSFLGSRRDRGELSEAERRALVNEAERVGSALCASGYFGPFGVDAFRFRDADGRDAFLPRCEINARYTMGWAAGMGDSRPDLEVGE